MREKRKGEEGDLREGQERREHRRKEEKVQEVMEGKGTREMGKDKWEGRGGEGRYKRGEVGTNGRRKGN